MNNTSNEFTVSFYFGLGDIIQTTCRLLFTFTADNRFTIFYNLKDYLDKRVVRKVNCVTNSIPSTSPDVATHVVKRTKGCRG